MGVIVIDEWVESVDVDKEAPVKVRDLLSSVNVPGANSR